MKKLNSQPLAHLDRLFHEPSRLAILSALCGHQKMSFNELKETCSMTDGNLSRHLKTLDESGVIRIQKKMDGHRSLTVVKISDLGREGFIRYLQNLETVLHKAAETVGSSSRKTEIPSLFEGFVGLEPLEAE